MKLVAIESPYAAREGRTVEQHVAYARLALKDSLRRGEAPIASHLLYPQVLPDVGEDRVRGIRAGLEWADLADAAVFYSDLGQSPGMVLARQHHDLYFTPVEDRYLFASVDELDAFLKSVTPAGPEGRR